MTTTRTGTITRKTVTMTDATTPRIPTRQAGRATRSKPGQAAKILVAGLSTSATLGLVAAMGHAASVAASEATVPATSSTPDASAPLVIVNGQTIRLDQLQQYLDALRASGTAVTTPPTSSPLPAPAPSTSGPGVQSTQPPSGTKVAPAPAVPQAAPVAVDVPTTAPSAPPVEMSVAPEAAPEPTLPATSAPAAVAAAPIVIDIPLPVPAPAPVVAPAPAQSNGSSRQS